MKKIILPLLAITLSISSCKKAEEEKTEPAQTTPETVIEETVEITPDSAAVAKAFEDYMMPSKAHEMLAKDTGTWDSELIFWMPDNPEPMKSTIVVNYNMILGGRYQEGIHKGKVWGQDFEGRALVAYDNATNQFISTWIDNMGTGIAVTKGTYDEASKTMTLTGTMVDPVTKKEKNVKEIITYTDDANQKMEMFDVNSEGKETKTMEVISKKRK